MKRRSVFVRRVFAARACKHAHLTLEGKAPTRGRDRISAKAASGAGDVAMSFVNGCAVAGARVQFKRLRNVAVQRAKAARWARIQLVRVV
jgi:hypothetical protein